MTQSDGFGRTAQPGTADIQRVVDCIPFNFEYGIKYERSGHHWLECSLSPPTDFAEQGITNLRPGLIISFIDATCGAAVLLTCENVISSVTINLHAEFVAEKPIITALIARAQCVHLTDQIAVLVARVEDLSGNVVAVGLTKFLCNRST